MLALSDPFHDSNHIKLNPPKDKKACLPNRQAEGCLDGRKAARRVRAASPSQLRAEDQQIKGE